MSRGLGVWQRRILERYHKGTPFYLTELLPQGMTPRHKGYAATYQALWRAYKSLLGWKVVAGVIYLTGSPSRLLLTPGHVVLTPEGEPISKAKSPEVRPPDPRSGLMRLWTKRVQVYGPPNIAPDCTLRLTADERVLVDATYSVKRLLSSVHEFLCRWCTQPIDIWHRSEGDRRIAQHLVAHARDCHSRHSVPSSPR